MEVFIPDNDSPAPDVVTIFRIAGWPGRGVCYGDRESVSKAPRPAATRGLREKTRRPGCKTISQGEKVYFFFVKEAVPSEPTEMAILPAFRPETTEGATS
jgi:hypothetical protein